MKVSQEETRRIAALARIELTDGEVESMSQDLSAILTFVEKINELDTAHVPETDHSLDIQNVFRGDKVAASLEREAALAMAPKTDGSYFIVPAIVE